MRGKKRGEERRGEEKRRREEERRGEERSSEAYKRQRIRPVGGGIRRVHIVGPGPEEFNSGIVRK